VIEYKDKFNNTKRKVKVVQKDLSGEEINQESEDFQTRKVLRNLDLIVDKKLLGELIAYNMKGNFDAVSALCIGIAGMEDTYNKHTLLLGEETQTSNELDFLIYNKAQFGQDLYVLRKTEEINNRMLNEINQQNGNGNYIDTESLEYQFSKLNI
jgi:hypothetical protein